MITHIKKEDQMLDWKGNLSDPKHRQRIIIEDIPEDDDIADASFMDLLRHQLSTICLINKLLMESNQCLIWFHQRLMKWPVC